MQQNTLHIPENIPKAKTFSPDLQQAINQIYLWVKDGCSSSSHFSKKVGLCLNIATVTEFDSLKVNLIFWGRDDYPFNSDRSDYNSEQNKYTNPKRLAWLQEHQTVE